MRRVCELALLAIVLAACTDGGPEPDSWELIEPEPTFEAHAGFQHQPERPRSIDPNSQPRLELVVTGELDPEEDYVCPYTIERRGFPAISEDGATVVDVYGYIPGNADESDARMELTWLDVDRTQVEWVYKRDEDWSTGTLDCDAALERVRERVAALNAKLASRIWRPLEWLDLGDGERAIEVLYRNRHFVARIPGVQVLQSTARPKWRQLDDEFCTTDPNISAIQFDRATRVALVRYDYSSGACLCDDRSYFSRIELSEELLAAADPWK